MRFRAGAALLFAFTWHLLSPLVAWPLPAVRDSEPRVASHHLVGPIGWLPRAAAVESLGRLPDSGPWRGPHARVNARLSTPGLTIEHERRATDVCRPSYPPRRALSRRLLRADDDSPA
jgi:hypothetical protein